MPSNVTPFPQQAWCSPEQPIWPPPGTCGPSPPSCFSQVAQADACWDQSQSLYNLITKVVMDIFAKNPGIIPPPPPTAPSSPLIGVTDGSAAQPGQVGEFIQTVTPITFGTATQVFNISAAVLQPGDWNAWAAFYPGAFCAGLTFFQTPVAVGASIQIMGLITDLASLIGGGSGETNAVVFSPVARCSLTVPTLFPFTVTTNVLGTGQGGSGEFVFCARRVR